jgi:putative oxidoreductase
MLEKLIYLSARAGFAMMFLLSGWGKFGAVEANAAYAASAGLPYPTAAIIAAGALELGAGLALLAGWRVILSAGALGLYTLLLAAIFHSDFGNAHEVVHFWKNIAIAAGLGHLAFFGGPDLAGRRFQRRLAPDLA